MCWHGQGTASGAPLGCRSIRVLSSSILTALFWVTLLKPKVEGAGSASGSCASSRAGAVLAPDVNATTSHLLKPGNTNPTDPPVPSLRNSIAMETRSPAPAARQSEGGHF